MSPLADQLEGLVISAGWRLVWVVAAGLAVWQVRRGRSLAGACLGSAAVLAILVMATRSLVVALFSTFAGGVGSGVALPLQALVFGLADALVLALLVAAAVLQRPPKPQ